MTKYALFLTCVLFAASGDKRVVFPASAKPCGPYSPGIFAGEFLYVPGQGARAPNGQIPATFDEQARQSFENLKSILDTAGLTMEHVVYTHVYMENAANYDAMNKVWAQYFSKGIPPARATVGVYKMPTDTPIEINAVAVRHLSRKKAIIPPGYRVNATHFESGNTPARATIQVASLPNGANIEFTGVAIRDLSKRRAIRPKNMPPSPTASPCVFADDTFFCSAKSGFIPGPNGGIFAEDVENQVRQTMRNLLDGLEEAGLDFSNVVSSNVYVDDLGEFTKMNGVYGKYFSSATPARPTVAPLPPVERKRSASGHAPMVEQVSIIAVK